MGIIVKHRPDSFGLLVLSSILALALELASPSVRCARADIPAGWPWKITYLCYPTIGYPVIIKKGETFTLEFDCHGKGSGGAQPTDVTGWDVTLVSSNDQFPTEVDCIVESSQTGVSDRWPGDSTTDYWKGSGPWAGREVWKVTVTVPSGTRTDLYDLQVTAIRPASIIDSQSHAVQVVDDYQDDYNFIQISDFHINDPRGATVAFGLPAPHPNSEEFIGSKYNLKAIDCVNRINPEFAVMTGDTVFGVPFFVEYPYASTGITDFTGTAPDWNGEYNEAYDHLLRLEVPIVCLPGNHDSHNLETDGGDPLEGHAKQDGAEIWPTIFGPRYFSWDYSDKCHLTCIWSFDRAPVDRSFSDWSLVFPEAQLPPLDYGGGVRTNVATPTPHWEDQMAWIEQDLDAAQGNYDLLVMATHHPFYGTYDDNDSFSDHTSRDKLRELSRDKGVKLALSGHVHLDNVFIDTTGGADIAHLNTTSTTFNTLEYPGFRRIFVSGGTVGNYNYKPALYSYPTYKDTTIQKHATAAEAFDYLKDLQIASAPGGFSPTSPGVTYKENACWNYLTEGNPAVTLDNTVVDFVMRDLGGVSYYQVVNGTLLQYWLPSSGYITLRVKMDDMAPGASVLTRVYTGDIVPLALMKNDGGDYSLYGYAVPEPGDWTYWDSNARNPSPLARDLWVIPAGNNAVSMIEVDTDDPGVQKLAALKGERGFDQDLYFYSVPVQGDWVYWDATVRNPSPLAQDLWMIPAGNDISLIADGGDRIASMKNQGGDYDFYLYNAPMWGDRTYDDALWRNPHALARDLWVISQGNDAVAMCGLDTTGNGESDSLLVVRNDSGDYNVYLWNMPAEGDWSYTQAMARNPSPRARDFWSIIRRNDIALIVGIDVTGPDYDALGVMESNGGDYNFYLWNAPAPGDWTYWDSNGRNPSPLARDLWVIPAGNNTIGLAAPRMGLPTPTP